MSTEKYLLPNEQNNLNELKEDCLNESYIEVIDPSLLKKAQQNILDAWEDWKNGPETEKKDIKPAQKELKKWLDDWFKKTIK
jgi:hypothetical protein